ncbi:MAG: hypothetical protein WA771_13425 [Chthoniobacterales bacterium]
MKISPLIIPASVVLFLFAACEEESRPRISNSSAANTGSNSYGYVPGDDTATDFVDTTPPPAPAPSSTSSTTTSTTSSSSASVSAPDPQPSTTTSQQIVVDDTTPQPTSTGMQETATTTTTTTESSLLYGTPVPGKAGFVTSPHAPYAGYVDVRGFPPRTEVKDPYSGKIFLVP